MPVDVPPPKLVLHDAVAQALREPSIAPGLHDGLLTRWLLIAEAALPDSRMGFTVVTASAAGIDLHTWDRLGLLHMALIRTAREDQR